jgi:hypothetical protein
MSDMPKDTFEFPVDYSKIREFARAVHADDSEHEGAGAVVPPTMFTSGRMIWEPKENSGFAQLGFDRSRILHGEEEFIFHAPLPKAGDRLRAATRIGERWEKEGRRGGVMKFARMVTEFWNDEDVLVATQNSVIVETARPPVDGGEQK